MGRGLGCEKFKAMNPILYHLSKFVNLIEVNHNVFSAVQSLLTCAGLIFGGFFLVYKIRTGWLYVNMAVAIETKRIRARESGKDHLALSINLEKGPHNSVTIKAIEVQLVRLNIDPDATENHINLSLQSFKPVGEPVQGKSVWSEEVHKNRVALGIAISPEEKVEHGTYALVPSEGIYRVEAAVFGTRRYLIRQRKTLFQWRSSSISLPIEEASQTLKPTP